MSTQAKLELLLIEDDLMASYVTKRILETLDCEVTTAESILTAVRILETNKFDLVVSDISLGDGKSFNIVRNIKADPQHINHEVAFVALTAHHEESYKDQAEKSGFICVLQKPLTQEKAHSLLGMYQSALQTNSKNITQRPVIDWGLAITRVGNEPMALEVLDAAVITLKDDRVLLEKAYQENNREKANFIVHKIKGAMSYCGLPSLEKAVNELAYELENKLSLANTQDLYKKVDDEMQIFMDEYQQFHKKA